MNNLPSQEQLESSSYRGKSVRLCSDGKYRWLYELNMLKNPAIFITVWKIFFYVILGLFIVFGFFLYVIHGDWEGLWDMTKAAMVGIAGFTVLTILGYLLVALMYGGKYIVLFEMDEKEVSHIQIPSQAGKGQKLGCLVALVGILAKKPTTAGAGMLAASKTSSTSVLQNVRKVKAYRSMNLIKVNQLLNKNQVYVPKEDFDFVYNFLKEHCPRIKTE